MRNNTGMKNEGRKLWVAPKLQMIKAGSAENGRPAGIPDGGPPGTARS